MAIFGLGGDVAALAEMLSRLSAFAVAAGDRLQPVDLNPVFAISEGEGAFAVDAVIEGWTAPRLPGTQSPIQHLALSIARVGVGQVRDFPVDHRGAGGQRAVRGAGHAHRKHPVLGTIRQMHR
jgi:hypothetical protein